MGFKVMPEQRLQAEANRLENILLMTRYSNRTWSNDSLKSELKNLGLNYTVDEYQALYAELLKRKIIEEVPNEAAGD